MGFGPPDASWYRTKLRPWILQQLAWEKVRARGIFRPNFVQKILEEHFSGKADHVALIWSLLSLERWCTLHGFYGGDLTNLSATRAA
jgi:asparagine synthase (glutamine-hydrolysing)